MKKKIRITLIPKLTYADNTGRKGGHSRAGGQDLTSRRCPSFPLKRRRRIR